MAAGAINEIQAIIRPILQNYGVSRAYLDVL